MTPDYVCVWVGPLLFGFVVTWSEERSAMWGWKQWVPSLELSSIEGPDGLVDEVSEVEMLEAMERAEVEIG